MKILRLSDTISLIKNELDKKNISQKKFAKEKGISASNLCNFLGGSKTPSLNTFLTILNAFDFEVNIDKKKKVRIKRINNRSEIAELVNKGISKKEICKKLEISENAYKKQVYILRIEGIIKKEKKVVDILRENISKINEMIIEGYKTEKILKTFGIPVTVSTRSNFSIFLKKNKLK